MIPDRWYPVLESRRLGQRPRHLKRLGRDVVLWRDGAGRAVAVPRACPHRGAGLERGKVVGGELQCGWHGFRFDSNGACTAMPCEGEGARIPPGLRLSTFPVTEVHGLIWLWHGEAREDLPPVPFFEDTTDLSGTSESSYVLPYHYSRMMETNLDIHHTPFIHGSIIPVGARVDPYEAKIEGDWIRTHGTLRRESGGKPFDFRVEALLPCLALVELTSKLRLVASATPVDEKHTWLWFRYHNDYVKWPPLRRLLSWIAVQSEVRLVQPQDWRMFRTIAKGTIDDVAYHFVRADGGIALYRRRRAELLDRAA